MDFLESSLRCVLLKDGAHLLEDLLNDPLYQGQEQEARPGEKRYRYRAKIVETLFGEVRLLRDYYVAADGSSRVPLAERLGLIEVYSPGLAKMMVRIAAQESFEEGREDFGALLRCEAFARRGTCAQKTVYLGDGAAWVWEVARINFPQAICILDFYHAGEHISLLAEALYCTDATRVQAQAKIWREMLLEDKLHEVLNLRTALLSNRFDDLWLSRDLKAA